LQKRLDPNLSCGFLPKGLRKNTRAATLPARLIKISPGLFSSLGKDAEAQ
jgi:hypothetical protein